MFMIILIWLALTTSLVLLQLASCCDASTSISSRSFWWAAAFRSVWLNGIPMYGKVKGSECHESHYLGNNHCIELLAFCFTKLILFERCAHTYHRDMLTPLQLDFCSGISNSTSSSAVADDVVLLRGNAFWNFWSSGGYDTGNTVVGYGI